MESKRCDQTPRKEHEQLEKKGSQSFRDVAEISAEISRLRRLFIITVATLLIVMMVLCFIVIAIGVGVALELD